MKSIKRVFSLMMVAALVLGINVPVSAEWKQNNNKQWTYIESDGSLKKGWLQDNGNQYYLNKNGIMRTGWISYQGKWYYLRENGSLNDSKTIEAMPNEIQIAYNIAKPFANDFNIEYAGQFLTPWNNSVFTKYDLDNKNLIAFSSRDNYGNDANYFLYDPYNCRVFVLYNDLTIKLLGDNKQNVIINANQIEPMVRNYLKDNQINIPNLTFNIVDEKNNSYFVLCQEINIDHVNTVEAYYVDKTTGMIIPRG
ncbi:hypothetical protein [Clostridium saccharoperbutylacetonicum]|uniref:hypothetical protein n=1 Tax=Clostridium saccharoperbutylacetonicum TaxID=36745 RepID=UPI0039E9F254